MYILISVPSSWHRATKILMVFYGARALGASFVLLILNGLLAGACQHKDQAMPGSLEFSALPLSFREGKGTRNEVNNWSYLHEEVSIILQ